MTKLIIFDLDGTLIDTRKDIADACNHALEQCGYPARKLEEYNMLVGRGIYNLFRSALPQGKADEATVSRMAGYFIPYYDEHMCDYTKPYDGIIEMLDRLHEKGVQFAVASNKYQDGTEQLVEKFFGKYGFVKILGQREGKPIKPDPLIVTEAMEGVPGITLDDNTETILENLNLITPDGKLKNAAILLFGKQPDKFFVSNGFKIGRFVSDESDLIIQDEIKGNIIQMTEKVIETLMSKYLVFHISYEGLQRIETLEIPEQALRELIYNAICHKAYPGEQVQMKIYNDRISLYNYGSLPDGFTVENLLQEHSSRQRNQNIARVFYLAGFIEAWGRGFRKIHNEFEKAGLDQPVYDEHCGGFRVTIKRQKSDTLFGQNGTLEHQDVTLENTDNKDSANLERQDVTLNVTLDDTLKSILQHISHNKKITVKELAEILEVSERHVKRYISYLRENGFLDRTKNNRYGEWIIKK